MKHTTSQFLFGYWNEIRNGRLAPKRFEIEPARMGTILPDAFILERTPSDTFNFRLTGTRIAEHFKAELRHVGFHEIWTNQDQLKVEVVLDDISARGGVGRIECVVGDDHSNSAVVEYVILPLIHTRNSIDRMVGAMSILPGENTDWLGTTPITSQEIVCHEVIWPEGRPHELAEHMLPKDQEPALAPHVRTARIVRVDRRQFRVYEGGRGKHDPTP